MLTIEKRRTEKIDWVKPLQKYISTQYSEQSANEHSEALGNLQTLREDCRNAADKSDAVKDLWLRYFYTLSQLEVRFPISEDNVRIPFTWWNSFGGKKVQLYSVHYERANALFNYAVLLSQLGAIQNRNAAEGVKLAAGYFQSAAGAFSELKEYVARHPECSNAAPDLSSECLSMLVALHLGQAQNCFVEKAVKDGMKDAIVAKLTAQAAEYYETANTLLNGPLRAVDRTFAGHVDLWAAIHKASYYYRLANSAAESMKYGEQVSRLIFADNLLTETKKKLTRYTPPELKDYLEKTSGIINKARISAEKDNNLIYNAIVIPENKLEAPEKKALVKPTPLVESPSITDWFAKLIPFAIKEAASRYREMKDDLVRKELQTLEHNNEVAKASLSSLNLPGAIEAMDTPTGIPPALVTKMESVKKENGPSLITDLTETLKRLAEEDQNILNKAIKILDSEEEEDNKLRSTHGAKWSRTPSHTLTPSLRQDVAKYKGHLEHSTKSDAFVAAKWRDYSPSVTLLAGPPGPVISLLGAGGTPMSSVDTVPLKRVLSELDSLIAAREAAKSELQALSAKDDIALKLLNAPGQSHEQVFGEELRKYDGIQAKLRENFQKQEQLLGALAEEHRIFSDARNADTAAQAAREQKEQALTKLADAFKAYKEVKAGLTEGINFYMNLQELLQAFNSKCSDFAMARDTEKTDLIQQIQQEQQAPPPQYQPPQYQQPPMYNTPQQPQVYPGYQPNAAPPPLYGSFTQQPPPYPYHPVAPPAAQQPPPYYAAPPPYGYQQPPYGRK